MAKRTEEEVKLCLKPMTSKHDAENVEPTGLTHGIRKWCHLSKNAKKRLQEDILPPSRIRLGMHISRLKSIEDALVPYSGISGAIGKTAAAPHAPPGLQKRITKQPTSKH